MLVSEHFLLQISINLTTTVCSKLLVFSLIEPITDPSKFHVLKCRSNIVRLASRDSVMIQPWDYTLNLEFVAKNCSYHSLLGGLITPFLDRFQPDLRRRSLRAGPWSGKTGHSIRDPRSLILEPWEIPDNCRKLC